MRARPLRSKGPASRCRPLLKGNSSRSGRCSLAQSLSRFAPNLNRNIFAAFLRLSHLCAFPHFSIHIATSDGKILSVTPSRRAGLYTYTLRRAPGRYNASRRLRARERLAVAPQHGHDDAPLRSRRRAKRFQNVRPRVRRDVRRGRRVGLRRSRD